MTLDRAHMTTTSNDVVVVLGASPKAERFSNQAVRLLIEHGYAVIPVNPAFASIEELPTAKDLRAIRAAVSTLSVYVGPERSATMLDDMVVLHPARVVLNPGTESPVLEAALRTHGIEVVHDCTLRMLREGRF